MKRKRIVVMGFMGSMPIAGVIWQHIHYIVGLQRLGHDVYYIEDSARLPYNPETFEVTDEFDYAAKILDRLPREFRFQKSLGVLRALFARKSDRGSVVEKNPATLSRGRRDPECLRHAGIQRRFAGERSHSLRRERSGRRANQDRQGSKIDNRLSETASRAFHIWRKRRHEKFSGADARIQMVADAATGGDRFVENKALPFGRRRFYVSRELVHQRPERHYLARQKISLEQIARVSAVRRRAEKSRRNV